MRFPTVFSPVRAVIYIFISTLLLTLAHNASSQTDSQVKRLGIFTNEQRSNASGDEHVMGQTITLYKEGDKLFGEFAWSAGLVESTGRGRLQDLQFNSKTKALSFFVQLSVGTEVVKGVQRTSRDYFEFLGKMYNHRIEGRLIHRDGRDMETVIDSTYIVLLDTNKTQIDRFIPDTPESYDQWLKTRLENEYTW